MTCSYKRFTASALVAAGLSILAGLSAQAAGYEIAVPNYGSSTGGFPFAVAMEGGFFKKAGVDITGIHVSFGGTADIRNMVAGDLPYAQTTLGPVLNAATQGIALKIVNENTHNNGPVVWVVKPDSPIKSIKDLKGARIGFTTPQSTGQILDILLLQKAGLKSDEAQAIAAGSFGAEVTMLENGGLDVAELTEPLATQNKAKFRVIGTAPDLFAPQNDTVGVSSEKVMKEHPEVLRAILQAHREATEFLRTNRKEAAGLINKVYKLDPDLMMAVVNNIEDSDKPGQPPYWSLGDINAADMDNAINGLKLVDAIKPGGSTDWRSLVDQSALPDDLKRDLK